MSTPFRLLLPRPIYLDLLAQARAELPNECCGLLAGTLAPADPPRARVDRRYPLVNALASPREYLSEPRSMFGAVRDLNARGLDILAVYHSHPASDPVPSRTDLERNYSETVMCLIVSLKGDAAAVRAWWLAETGYREADWEVVD